MLRCAGLRARSFGLLGGGSRWMRRTGGGNIYFKKTILKDRGKRVILYLVNELQVPVLCRDVDRGVAHLFLGD